MDGWPAGEVTTLHDLQTPCLILDRVKLNRNLKRMSSTMRGHGITLRPHLKTAKSSDVARLATEGEAGGITVSTLAEAEYFASHGFKDILLAAALPPAKLDRASALLVSGIALTLVTDHPDAAAAVAAHHGAFRALIEIDSGDHRAGLDPSSPVIIEIGKILGDKLTGVMTHAGHSYSCRDVPCIRKVAEAERRAVVTASGRLRDAGMECAVVSVGSTPTMTHAERLDGVTEGRPGVYMFHDLLQAEIHSCSREDIAVTVLTSVIGVKPEEGRFLVDSGALALSKDRSTQATVHDRGFGEVWDINGRRTLDDCFIERVFQEHGVAVDSGAAALEGIRIGTRLRIGPNHACLTAAAYDRYYVVDGGLEVVAAWDRVNGW